jgi:hypothetical protein
MRAHGSYVRYVQGPDEHDVAGKGCRCSPCRKANSDYEKARQQRVEPAYIAAGPARAHIEMLAQHGIGLKTIAKTTGISHGGLTKLMRGNYNGRGPSKRIRKSTADAILAMHPGYDQRGGTRVDAGPVWKMVEELIAAGVPKVRVAERIGQSTALQLGREYVTRRNAAAIKAMYDEYRGGNLATVKRQRTHSPAGAEIEPHPYVLLAEIVETRNEQADWRRDAACRNRPTYMWFPARGDGETARHAQRICDACTVRARCLAANLHERDGIYGGLSPKRRRPLFEAVA